MTRRGMKMMKTAIIMVGKTIINLTVLERTCKKDTIVLLVSKTLTVIMSWSATAIP
jgi:hypothetical protein